MYYIQTLTKPIIFILSIKISKNDRAQNKQPIKKEDNNRLNQMLNC